MMNKRRRWIFILLVGIIAAGITFIVLRPREPTYQGRPVSFWFHQYAFSLSPTREETLESMAEIGAEAIPYLARMLRRKESWTGRTYRSQWPRLPEPVKRWLPRPIDPARRHVDAMACLSRLSLSFNTAIPPLIEALDDPDLRIPAIHTLGQMASTGPGRGRIAAALSSATQDASPFVRREAVAALSWAGRSVEDKAELRPAVPALIKALDDSDKGVRTDAAVALRELGPAAKESVPALRKRFEDPKTDAEERPQLAHALVEIEPDSPGEALRNLIAHKGKDCEPNLSDGIGVYFGKPKLLAPSAIPSLIALLRDHEDSQCFAALMLGRMGSLAVAAVPALQSNLEDSHAAVRLLSALALRQIDPGQTQRVATVLIALLENPTYRAEAARALMDIGPEASATVPALIGLLDGGLPFWREVAGQALCRIDPSQKSRVVPVFLELLSRKDITYSSRLSIVESLGNIGPEAHVTVPILLEHLKHRDRRIRLAAAEALWKIDGRQVLQVVSFLIGHLESKDCWHRELAAEVLGEIGPLAKEAVPALKLARDEGDKRLGVNAIKALKRINGATTDKAEATQP